MKLFLRTISTLLAVLMVLGSMTCLSVLNVSAAEKEEEEEVKTASTIDYTTEVFNKPEEVLEYMTLYMENDNFQMYFNDFTAAFAVVNKKTGQISLSNPYDVASSIGSANYKQQILSQIIIKYIDNDQQKEMYSYKDAALNNQLKVKKIKTGVRVEYTIGDEATRKLAPRLISRTNFDTLIKAPMEEAIGGTHSFARVCAFYTLQDLDAATSKKGKEALLQKYPICAEMDVYSLDPTISSVELNFIEEQIKGYCPDYTFDQMDADHAETGYESENELSPVFKMALEYTLNEDGFTVRLPTNGVRFNSTLYSLEHISILPYMGAGNSYNTGYTFYPDGSGALFAFEDLAGKQTYTTSRRIYGLDYAYHNLDGGTYQKALRMPVFGIKEDQMFYTYTTTTEVENDETGETELVEEQHSISATVAKSIEKLETLLDEKVTAGTYDDYSAIEEVVYQNGYFAIIEEGESLCKLATYHAGSLNDYHTIMNYFNPRPKDSYDLSDAISVSESNTMTIVSDRKYTGNFKIRYVMLSDPALATETGYTESGNFYAADYVGMASAYTDYLAEKEILSRLTDADVTDDIPLYIESFGAIEVTEQIMSFPVEVMKPLATFDDIELMYKELSEAGVKNINFKLTGYANGGMYATAPTKLKWEKSVGGKAEFEGLLDYANTVNKGDGHLGIFPEFELQYLSMTEMFDGIRPKRDLIRTIDNRYTSKRYYDPCWQTHVGYFERAISPAYIDRIYTKLLGEYAEYADLGGMGISLSTMGTDLNTDFDEDEPYNREDNKTFLENALAAISSDANVNGIMADGANAYTWKYLDHILNVDLDSSRFMKASRSIPFVGLVLHGYIQFAGTPINMEGDANYAMLKAIENGSSLYFTLSYRNTSELKEFFQLSQYYSINYAIWKEDVISLYNELNSVMGDIQTKLIVDHEFIEGIRILDADEIQAEIAAAEAERAKYEAQYDEQMALERIREIAAARAAAKSGVETMEKILEQLKEDAKNIKTATAEIDKKLRDSISKWEAYQNYLNRPNATEGQIKAALKSYRTQLTDARKAATNGIQMAQDALKTYDEVLQLQADAAKAVDLLTAAGAAEELILDAQKCAEDTASYLSAIEEQVQICQSYVATIYEKAAAGNITKEEIDEYLITDEEEKEEEVEEEVNPYLINNGNIVAVTYGDKDGLTVTPYKTFILNYNNFAVTVNYDVDGVAKVYTIPANEYVVIQH